MPVPAVLRCRPCRLPPPQIRIFVLVAACLVSCWNGTEPSETPDVRLLTDFEGASLGWSTRVSSHEFYISIRHDTNSGFVRWYSFRVVGGRNEELTFRITNATGTSSDSAWAWDQPVVSADGGQTWSRITDTEYEGPEGRFFTFRYTPQSDSDWIAYTQVYNYSRWIALVEELTGHPKLDTIEVIAHSNDGNPIHLLKVTDTSVVDTEKTAVFAIARQHAADAGASWMAEGLLNWLTGQDPAATELLRKSVVYVVPFMNPDGVLRGNYVANASGVNLNRQWGVSDPAIAPEVFAVSRRMREFFEAGGTAELFVDLQTMAVSRSNFLYYNAAAVTSPEMASEIQAFAATIAAINADFTDEGSEVWPGDTTIASRWAADEFGIHGVILEASFQDVDYGPFRDQYMTIDRYVALGEALGKAIAEFFFGIDASGSTDSRPTSDRY